MATREESACRCKMRRDETNARCEACSEEDNFEELTFDTVASQQQFMQVIGLQCPHRVATRLSCSEEELQQEFEDGECEDQASADESMESSENECEDMMMIGGTIYHLHQVTARIINTMTDEERHIYDTLMGDKCQ